jgi:hypothetical protein
MNKKYLSAIIAVLLFLVTIVLRTISQKKLESEGIIVNARTLNWASSASMGRSLKYEFYFKGERIEGDTPFPQIKGLRSFEGRFFPAIYEPKTGLNELLIFPDDFEKYKIKFPDSLNWVRPYLKK